MKRPPTTASGSAKGTNHDHPAARISQGSRAAGDPIAPTRVRSLLRDHLGRPSLNLFEKLTGHQVHAIWHSPHDFEDPVHLPVFCPAARKRLQAGKSPLPDSCAICLHDTWRPLNLPPHHGRSLQGACGATCFWAALQSDSLRIATLTLYSTSPSPRFDQAVLLLRQIILGAESALAVELARRQWDQILQMKCFPGSTTLPTAASMAHDTSRGNAIVHMMLEYLHHHYQTPMGLADVAAALDMNGSYLSHLFSTTVGTHFHDYLCELRLARAKDLLLNPASRICEVAAATGHSSPNCFNNIFKASVGMSPSAWRRAALQ